MSASLDDTQLIESYQAAQDPRVFAELVQAHQAALLGHAMRRLQDRAAAEDAVQETFVRAYRALPRFSGEYRLGPWLHRIMTNVCIDEANRRRRESEKFDRVSSQPDAIALVPDVEEQLGIEHDDSALQEALGTLSPSYREALSLRFVDELSYDELARAAGVSEQNARARVSRARNAMRAALQGVAVVAVLFAGVLRRGERAAAALQLEAGRAGTAATSVSAAAPAAASSSAAAPVSVHVSSIATALAPAVDAANAAVVAAPQAMPLVTKAVIGLGMAAAVAVPTAGPAVMNRTPAPTAVTQPQVPVSSSAPAARGPGAAETTVGGDPVPTTTPATSLVPALDVTPTTTAPSTTATTVASTAAPTASTTATTARPAPSTTANIGPATTAVPAVTVPPAPSAGVTTAPTPVETTVPPPSGGTMSGSGLATSPAGPRVDVAGPVKVTVSGVSHAGQLSARIGFSEPDAAGLQRVDAVLTLTLDAGRTLDVRLAGEAVAADPAVEGASPRAVTLSGAFRAPGNDIRLLESGSASGTLDLRAGTLSLTLAG